MQGAEHLADFLKQAPRPAEFVSTGEPKACRKDE
jgi:hypothetical protein